MQKNCGYFCIQKVLDLYGIKVNFENFTFDNSDKLSFKDFKTICECYGIKGAGYYIELEDVPVYSILHLKLFNIQHYIVLLHKGVLITFFDNGRTYRLPKFIIKRIYTNHAFFIKDNLDN